MTELPRSPADDKSNALKSLLVILAAAVLLLIPGLINGGPFLYRDTTTYFKGAELGAVKLLGDRFALPAPASAPDDTAAAPGAKAAADAPSLTSVRQGVTIAGRSVYYGALLYLALLAGSLFLAAVAQALTVSYVLHLFFQTFRPLRTRHFLILIAVLALATPVGYLTDMAMPDVFAGLAVLIVAMIVHGYRQIGRGNRIALFLILAFAMLCHSSHLPLAIALLLVALAAAILRYLRPDRLLRPMLLVTGAIFVGLAGEIVFTQAATRMLGDAPLRLPHLSAHLVAMGPGTTYLKAHCPAADFTICADRSKFPVDWEDFLFSTAPDRGVFALADVPRKRAISAEQLRFAGAVLRDQPAAVIGGFGLSFVQQLGMFRTNELYYPADLLSDFSTRLPAREYARAVRSRAAGVGHLDTLLTVTSYGLAIASLVAIIVMLARLRTARLPVLAEQRRVVAASLLIVAGIVINAAVCGIIASPYDRFQARVIWLLPVVALALWSIRAGARTGQPAANNDANTGSS